MNQTFSNHLERLQSALFPDAIKLSIPDFIEQRTFLKGQKFSFIGHEYQKVILLDPAKVKYIKKCSQIGISELEMRWLLALANLHAGFGGGVVFPTIKLSTKFTKTRFDPCIAESPWLRENVSAGVDSAEIKGFKNGSFLYFTGASRTSSSISSPMDAIIFDEVDFVEDPDISSKFTSRLTHSKFKYEMSLSTPTVPNYGIDALYSKSVHHVEMYKCCHCNYYFLPNYFSDVVIPGTSFELKELTYQTREWLDGIDLSTVYIACPKCRLPVSQDIQYREWVVENPDCKSDASGYHITPFSAPASRTPGDLVQNSVKYCRVADFYNFTLGEPCEDQQSGLSVEEARSLFITEALPSGAHVMGLDMGGMCACTIAKPYYVMGVMGLFVVHTELIPLADLEIRIPKLWAQFCVISMVVDALPYTDTVMRLQRRDPRCLACSFTRSNAVNMYVVKEPDASEDGVLAGLRQVIAQRDSCLDLLVGTMRQNLFKFQNSAMKETIVKHLTSLKRVDVSTFLEEQKFTWKKTDGDDHFFFSALYVLLAALLQGEVLSVNSSLPLLNTMTIRNKSDEKFEKSLIL